MLDRCMESPKYTSVSMDAVPEYVLHVLPLPKLMIEIYMLRIHIANNVLLLFQEDESTNKNSHHYRNVTRKNLSYTDFLEARNQGLRIDRWNLCTFMSFLDVERFLETLVGVALWRGGVVTMEGDHLGWTWPKRTRQTNEQSVKKDKPNQNMFFVKSCLVILRIL